MVAYIIILILVGLVAGAIARLLVPGRDPMGILGSILGAILVLVILRLTGMEKGRRRVYR